MTKFFGSAALAALCLSFTIASCSDSLSEVGATTRPFTDGITIKQATYNLPMETVYRDSVFVRTGYPLLGAITDLSFGEINAGYLAQFYANKETGLNVVNSKDSTVFDILRTSVPKMLNYDWSDYHYASNFDSLVSNRIDSMTIRVYYQTYYGDSLAPMQLSIYSLNSDVDFATLDESNFYSNNDFSKLYTDDAAHLLGKKGYTTANREVSDSVRQLKDYMDYIEVKLDDKYKDDFFKLCVEAAIARDKKNPHHKEYTDIFSNPAELRKSWLSGVCVKPTFGDGSLIKVYYTAIYFFYSSLHRYAEDGTLLRTANDDADSSYVQNHTEYIAVTPDVIQMSGIKFVDDNKKERLAAPDTAYISSPQGYYSTIDLPLGRMMSDIYHDPLRNDSSYFINAANFYLKAYKPKGYVLSKTPAPTLLMVRNDSVNTFFEERKLPSSNTSCYASYVCDSVPKSYYHEKNEGIYYYRFGNIGSTITGLAENRGWQKSDPNALENWEKHLRAIGDLKPNQQIEDYVIKMALIPVEVTANSNGSTVLSVSNYVLPTAVRLKKEEQNLQLIYTYEGQSPEN